MWLDDLLQDIGWRNRHVAYQALRAVFHALRDRLPVLGGLINIPVHRIEREEQQLVELVAVYGFLGWMPRFRRVRYETIIAC